MVPKRIVCSYQVIRNRNIKRSQIPYMTYFTYTAAAWKPTMCGELFKDLFNGDIKELKDKYNAGEFDKPAALAPFMKKYSLNVTLTNGTKEEINAYFAHSLEEVKFKG